MDSKLAGVFTGLLLLASALLIAYSTSAMRIAPIYAKVGPQVFPYVASIALALAGVYFLWQAMSGRGDPIVADSDSPDWRAVGFISAGFIFVIASLEALGFILSTVILFMAIAFAFGSRRWKRDGLTAIVLCVTAYLVFTRFLNLQLPAGLLKGIV